MEAFQLQPGHPGSPEESQWEVSMATAAANAGSVGLQWCFGTCIKLLAGTCASLLSAWHRVTLGFACRRDPIPICHNNKPEWWTIFCKHARRLQRLPSSMDDSLCDDPITVCTTCRLL